LKDCRIMLVKDREASVLQLDCILCHGLKPAGAG